MARLADPESRPALPPPGGTPGWVSRHGDPDWMVNQLPVGMVQNDFFVRFVSIFQDVATTLLDDADNLEHIPDLTVTPTSMISLLGRLDRGGSGRREPARGSAAQRCWPSRAGR